MLISLMSNLLHCNDYIRFNQNMDTPFKLNVRYIKRKIKSLEYEYDIAIISVSKTCFRIVMIEHL